MSVTFPYMWVCPHRSLLWCNPSVGPAADAFTVVALLQPGGGYLAGRRSQCAMYSLPLRSLCRCSRRQSARRDPAVPCVLCSARTRVSASPAHTSRCRVWPPHCVHGLASRAVFKVVVASIVGPMGVLGAVSAGQRCVAAAAAQPRVRARARRQRFLDVVRDAYCY